MKKTCLLPLLVIILVIGVDAVDDDISSQIELQESHNILVEGVSWRAYDIDCQKGDMLSGSFEVACDGSLFIGDEKKYDDWSLEGIQFYILDSVNYSLFVEGLAFVAAYARNNVLSLRWTFEVPTKGVWYIVYYNDSIYIMTVNGTLGKTDAINNFVVLTLVIIGGFTAVGWGFIIKRKNESHG